MTDDRIEPKERAQSILAEIDREGLTADALGAAEAAAINIFLNNSGGYIALNWTNSGAVGRWDYVALYDGVPTDPYGYLTLQWQWVESPSGNYVTGTRAMGITGPQYYIAYCGWDYASKAYKIVQTAGPSQP
ncbi:MAG: hypothetical protein AB1941_13725 [Gemmatimonadota bacterium]